MRTSWSFAISPIAQVNWYEPCRLSTQMTLNVQYQLLIKTLILLMPIQPFLTIILMTLMNLFQLKFQMTIQMIMLLLIIPIRMIAFLFGILVKVSKLYYQSKIRLSNTAMDKIHGRLSPC